MIAQDWHRYEVFSVKRGAGLKLGECFHYADCASFTHYVEYSRRRLQEFQVREKRPWITLNTMQLRVSQRETFNLN